jgi:glutathione synthase/RimK-type ligase-like ATP-grasp enzyme
MKQILVIGGLATDPDDRDEISRFAEGVRSQADQAAEVQYTHLDKLQFVLAPGDYRIFDTQNQRQLTDYQLVILRSKMRTHSTLAYCLSKFLTDKGIDHFNDYSSYFNGTKLVQAVLFYDLELPFLKTVYAYDHAALIDAASRELQLPCIFKDAYGAHGNSNYLIRSREEADKVLAAEPDVQFIAQEYCPNDRDYRVLIMGEEQLVFERQGSADTHLNNTSQGASAQLAPDALPAEILQQATDIADHMQLTIAGIDVMPRLGTNDYYFLETNAQPQLFTGALLPEKAAHFKQFLYQRLDGRAED